MQERLKNMTQEIRQFIAPILLLMLVACGQKEAAVEVPKGPPIPTLNVSQILDMSKNERQELERRCLGVTHPTCTELKSDSFNKLRDFRIASCKTNAAFKGLSDRYEGMREERKCDEMF